MGGSKKKRQQAAETTSKQATQQEQIAASNLQKELDSRRSLIGDGLNGTMQSTRTGAEDLRNNGGFSSVPAFDPKTIDTSGRGMEGYTNLSMTGGFSPEQKQSFLRRATAPVSAMFSRVKDELGRRVGLQGGYSPGFDASQSRLLRQSSQAGSEASLNANVDLNNQVRSGQLAGLGGMERIKSTATNEALGARGQDIGQQQAIQSGKIAGQDALQRYTQLGVSALSDIDINELRNRLQVGQMSQADAQLLTQLAAQDKTLFEKIMQGVSTVGGAAAGVLTGAGAIK